MIRIFVVSTLLCFLFAQTIASDDDGADTYYANIDASATDDVLKGQLFSLINPHTVISYDDAWAAFAEIDLALPAYPCSSTNASEISDIYSNFCWETYHLPDASETGGECGNYKAEGDCYNREHCWPKSWFGGFHYGMNAQSDLFELWPSDGYVNSKRGDLPFGYIDPSSVTFTSSNGCRIGKCASADATGNCFEIADYLKGDLARSYFYLSTAYWNQWACCDTVGTNGSDMKTWIEDDMRSWHKFDPVDSDEQERNNMIYNDFQHNRNPFIDHPEWVDQISDF